MGSEKWSKIDDFPWTPLITGQDTDTNPDTDTDPDADSEEPNQVIASGCGQLRKPAVVQTMVVRRRDWAFRKDIPAQGSMLGTYRLLSLLGEGATGVVFVAEHSVLGRKVALKILKGRYGNDPRYAERFFAEAQAVTDIEHENIVTITDFVVGDGSPTYYIMELLDGHTLATRMNSGPPLSLKEILTIGIQLCAALSSAHEKGIIHRDVKPENIFLSRYHGKLQTKLLDFGVAKLTSESTVQKRLKTDVGIPVGTPDYMSPEATLGVSVDQRTDIYSLGVVLYEAIASRRPFEGNTVSEMLELHRTAVPKPPTAHRRQSIGFAEELDAIVLR